MTQLEIDIQVLEGTIRTLNDALLTEMSAY